jgi:hypothetical protein
MVWQRRLMKILKERYPLDYQDRVEIMKTLYHTFLNKNSQYGSFLLFILFKKLTFLIFFYQRKKNGLEIFLFKW